MGSSLARDSGIELPIISFHSNVLNKFCFLILVRETGFTKKRGEIFFSMKVTFFKGVSVSIYFMYLTQLSEKQTICSTPSLQIKQFSDIKHLFLQRFSLFQRKISFFECVSFLPLFLVKIQQRVIRNLKPERSLALQMNTSLARRS